MFPPSSIWEIAIVKKTVTGIIAVIMLLATQLVGYACDLKGLKTNMSWVKAKNPGSASTIDGACILALRAPLDPNDFHSACFKIENAFRDGESHDAPAAQTIDGCKCEQIVDIACH
jgi:hypothetical protein